MNDEQHKPIPQELLQIKDRVLEQWRLLPAEHQATMSLVLLKEIDNAEMSAWTRIALATLYPSVGSSESSIALPAVTRDKLAQLDIAEHELAMLTDEDIHEIARRIERAFQHDEALEELWLQILEFHTEQVLKTKQKL